MISAEQVQKLNNRIEGINRQRTMAVGRLEVLTGNLNKSLEQYLKLYGVDCSGESLKVTAEKIKEELGRVEAAIESEYELRMKVVSAIESGNIEEANILMGIAPEEPAEEIPEELVLGDEDTDGDTDDEFTAHGVSISGGIGGDVDEDDTEDIGFFGDIEDDEPAPSTGMFNFGDLNLDDDFLLDGDAPEKVPSGSESLNTTAKKPSKGSEKTAVKKAGGKKLDVNAGTSVSDTVSSLEGSGSGFGDLDLDLDDFGFGDMLKNTQFTI